QAEAEAEKAKIIEQGYAEVENERRRVQEELRQKVAALAVAGAEKIVGRSVDAAANNDIIDKLVAEL
ncbi:F0F1 ATP synthase subunit B, partial [Glaesserella parasuis]|nr:F0F1 ATP synthase subunit B [Glaesserella parasuis]MDE3983062.1 F0F1 ATP synthase subunit B [Glaesserella parasuis]MDE3999543.1 F0F1 ATP synthase subunit B [Glaesserella parasuis]MDE4006434.1 F0F1 ATP synthase subunit B [Glaesserella parasuis]